MLGQFGQLLRAIAGGPDPAAIPPPGEVIATIDAGSSPPSWDYSKGLYRYSGYAIEAAGVGNRSTVQLWNPSGTHTVATIEQIFGLGESYTWACCFDTSAATDDDGVEHALDVRLRLTTYVNRLPACKVRSRTGAFMGTAAMRITPDYYDATYYYYHSAVPIVLWPGSGFIVNSSGDNQLVQANFIWTERDFDEEELRGVRPGLFT